MAEIREGKDCNEYMWLIILKSEQCLQQLHVENKIVALYKKSVHVFILCLKRVFFRKHPRSVNLMQNLSIRRGLSPLITTRMSSRRRVEV